MDALNKHFPTVHQAVIFRNCEIIQPSKLAEILETDENTILSAAKDMGLRLPPQADDRWLKHGYITIIRNNRQLMPVEQLARLLDWDEEQLYCALKKDDFLRVKLDRSKPETAYVKYRPLNEKEQKQTEKIRETMARYFGNETTSNPFRFIDDVSLSRQEGISGYMQLISELTPEKLSEGNEGVYSEFSIHLDPAKVLSLSKNDLEKYNEKIAELRSIIRQKQKLAIELWQIMDKSKSIGFKSSSHYYYTENNIKEKVINCQYLLDKVFIPVVTQADVEAALRELGISDGDIVLVHSSLSSLGYVVNGAQAVINAFEAVIGKEGTLVFPTLCLRDFARSYEIWHLDKPSDVGYLTEYFRKLPGVLRSNQATHSVAARGKYAYELTFEHAEPRGLRYGIFGDTPFSEASPWQKLYDMGAKVVFLGVTMRKNTMKHFMEYRVVNETLEKIKDEETRKRLKGKIWHFNDFRNRGNKIWPFHDAEQLQQALDKAGMIRKAVCGKAELICVNIKEMVDTGMKWFEEDPETWYTPEVLEWLNEAKEANC
ncbi:MAG: AAC(3) family N-acetyltransferase [Clostridiales bacterium]|nr:AAC(3) family N-acetyltransferase [Clostridiales bacterium]